MLVLREPYNLVHLRNMVKVTEAGAIVMPASPSFYSAPEDLWAFVDTVTARALDPGRYRQPSHDAVGWDAPGRACRRA